MKTIEIVSLSGELRKNAERIIEEIEKRCNKFGINGSSGASVFVRLLAKSEHSNLGDLNYIRFYTSDSDDVKKLCEALKYIRQVPEGVKFFIDYIAVSSEEHVFTE